ncbi:terminase small subunit [Butyrivibrio proteoclasticus]|uniref:terminase small subunit n=1 Tax=Butyrivibrio proteoclasticus TaxID=43305 RepID=UPI00047BEF01|nr:terminase small subunit [Butyrivibrio proteoclasticus]
MSNKQSNYPTATMNRNIQQADGFIADTVHSISELATFGKPENEEQLKERIKQYFDFCANNNFRPGVESLSLALGVDRVTYWRWCNQEIRVSNEWAETCKLARQSIVAFVEAAANSGHLSPPIAIFSLKNLANWKDTISFEDATPHTDNIGYALSVEELPTFNNLITSNDDEYSNEFM